MDKSKKVIFIGSTRFSGSTFFDMILANDPAGFSCGEVYAMFRPHRPYHHDPRCGCNNPACTIWSEISKKGARTVYESIFDNFPDVNFIVDSSKNLHWIKYQTGILKKKNIRSENILIWKTPLELARSYQKRDIPGWERAWINYHRMYFAMVKEWKAIAYSQLVCDKSSLVELCEYLEIPYFEGKEKYWEKTHHLLFGNNSAKVHLFKKNSNELDELRGRIGGEFAEAAGFREVHRSVYRESSRDNALEVAVNDAVLSNNYILAIQEILKRKSGWSDKSGDITLDGLAMERLAMPTYPILLRKLKEAGVSWARRLTSSQF